MRSTQRRITVGGLTEDMGILLRRDLEWLPRKNQLKLESRSIESELANAHLENISIEEALSVEPDSTAALNTFFEKEGITEPTEELFGKGLELLTSRRQALRTLQDGLTNLVTIYDDEKELFQKLEEGVRSYRALIEENILWIRSSARNPLDSLLGLPRSIADLSTKLADARLGTTIRREVSANPVASVSTAVFFLVLLAGRGFLIRKRIEMGPWCVPTAPMLTSTR